MFPDSGDHVNLDRFIQRSNQQPHRSRSSRRLRLTKPTVIMPKLHRRDERPLCLLES